MREAARRTSWHIKPCPAAREYFDLPLAFSNTDAETLKQGTIPRDMDDKWFIFFEDGWLYFCRSWTGFCVFAVRLDASPPGVRVISAWASRDEEQYRTQGVEHDRKIVTALLQSLLR